MLRWFSIKGFKSLNDVKELALPRMTVLFGPNAAGKSNFLDAVQALSRIGTSRTLSDALQDPIRGYPLEAFSLRSGGLRELLIRPSARFELEALLRIEKERYQYRVGVQIDPRSGSTMLDNEYLAALTATGTSKGSPLIERVGDDLRIRRRGKPAHPRTEPIGLNHSLLSDPRLGGIGYKGIERCRDELSRWRTYYLDPRVSMRRAVPPSEVDDIGVFGEDIAPFLYRLRADSAKDFEAIRRTLRVLIPSVENISVDLDERRGTLDIMIRQNGVDFSSRVISEGTLRVLALCAVVVNPWSGSLIAFEEPENGVHPRRLELIAELLSSVVVNQKRQLIVTTHSPLFCTAMLRKAREYPADIGLFTVRQIRGGTEIQRFETDGPLFQDMEIAGALTERGQNGVLEGLILRGMLGE